MVNERDMLQKMNEDMYCTLYDVDCLDVPSEVTEWIDGLGFSAYECNLDCANCEHMEELC